MWGFSGISFGSEMQTVAPVNVGSNRIASGCNLYVTLITLAHPRLLTLFVYKSNFSMRSPPSSTTLPHHQGPPERTLPWNGNADSRKNVFGFGVVLICSIWVRVGAAQVRGVCFRLVRLLLWCFYSRC